jgi:hypothetical protein
MIGGRACISCWNREREVRIGRNAKNTCPQLVLESRRLGVILAYGSADQRYIELRDVLTRESTEMLVQVLSITHGRVAFCKPRGGPSISTAELARQMGAGRSQSRGIIAHAVAKPALRKTLRAAPIDRVPNEFRSDPGPDVSHGGEALARDLAMGIAS